MKPGLRVTLAILIVTTVLGLANPFSVQAETSALCAYWQSNITQWSDLITKYSADNGLDPNFVASLIEEESKGNPRLISPAGAVGLMQIMPYVAESLAQDLGIEWSGDRTLFNPYLNIRMGIHYLSQLMLDFKDVRAALTAYNYGPTYVKGLIEKKERIPYDYYRRFLTAYKSI